MIISHSTTHHHLEDNTPEQLKRIPAWMGCRFERRADGKLNKPPYCVRNGRAITKAAKNDPKNWAKFEEALAALARGDVDGIGIVLSKTDPYTVVDLDEAIDPETGEMSTLAASAADTLDSYTEVSVSGTGLHIICEADKPGKDCTRKDLGIEVYDGRSGARFLVITGDVLFGPGADGRIMPRQEEIEQLYEEWWPAKKSAGRQVPREGATPVVDLDDAALLERARRSRSGKRFIKLFDHGERSGYKSANEADFALINMLIFWCAGDGDRVEELFERSALYRPPPDKHKTYVSLSVEKALASYSGSYYQPKAVREKSTQEREDILTPYLEILLDAARWKGQTAAAAYKAYTALILLSVENGIATDADHLRVGTDIRSLAELSGVNRKTLQRSALPYLWHKDRGLLQWKREPRKSGVFILPKPSRPSEVSDKGSNAAIGSPSKVLHGYFTGGTYGTGLDTLRRLIRMRSGYSITGRSRVIGDFEKATRLGMVPMFCMVVLTSSPRGLRLEELVGRMGRQRRHVRGALDKLIEKRIVVEPRAGYFELAEGFWEEWQTELENSHIVAAERTQRKRHAKERREHEERTKTNRAKWAAKHDPKVVELAAQRRKKLDEAARREQPVDNFAGHHREKRPYKAMWEDRDWLKPEERGMQDDYDRMVERCMERLKTRRRSSG